MSIVFTKFVDLIIDKTDVMTAYFIKHAYGILSTMLLPPLGAAAGLYIVLTGYLMLMGFISMSTKEFVKIIFTIGLVFTFIGAWTNYDYYFVELFQKGANELQKVGMNAGLFQIPGADKSLYGSLQAVLNEFIYLGCIVWNQAGTFNFIGPLIIALVYIVGAAVIVGIAVLEIIMAKFFICILLATGPLFIGFAIFPETRGVFKAWLSALSSYAIALILIGFAVGMSMYFMHWVVEDIFNNKEIVKSLATNTQLGKDALAYLKNYTDSAHLAPLIIVQIISAVILTGVIPLAKQIGGAIGGGGVNTGGGMTKSLAAAAQIATTAALPAASLAMRAGARIMEQFKKGGGSGKSADGANSADGGKTSASSSSVAKLAAKTAPASNAAQNSLNKGGHKSSSGGRHKAAKRAPRKRTSPPAAAKRRLSEKK